MATVIGPLKRFYLFTFVYINILLNHGRNKQI